MESELRELAGQVERMRAAQRAYFEARRNGAGLASGHLVESKRLEREVDRRVAAILEPPGLFGRAGSRGGLA